ncbi:MAG: membrane lipoprotein lipid attachment site-containing protein [Candidatus Peribacteraceae bacterium]|nr:membrane lipoprotein lipid attachment site-containing protein [Candidatus Peribacteraceae bacterium]
MKKIFIALVSTTLLAGCGNTYQGFYYPNGCLVCEEDWILSPVFETREECILWIEEIENKRQNPNDDFECGKNCRANPELDTIQICDETFDF